MKRKCSRCYEIKDEEKEFRYMKKQNRYNCYCKSCEKKYRLEWSRYYTQVYGYSYTTKRSKEFLLNQKET